MKQLHLDLDELEIESLEIVGGETNRNAEIDLDSMMLGHGILEIGASDCGGCGTGSSCCVADN